MNHRRFVKRLRSVGEDGDAIYCWSKCIEAANLIEQQAEEIKLLKQLLDAREYQPAPVVPPVTATKDTHHG